MLPLSPSLGSSFIRERNKVEREVSRRFERRNDSILSHVPEMNGTSYASTTYALIGGHL